MGSMWTPHVNDYFPSPHHHSSSLFLSFPSRSTAGPGGVGCRRWQRHRARLTVPIFLMTANGEEGRHRGRVRRSAGKEHGGLPATPTPASSPWWNAASSSRSSLSSRFMGSVTPPSMPSSSLLTATLSQCGAIAAQPRLLLPPPI